MAKRDSEAAAAAADAGVDPGEALVQFKQQYPALMGGGDVAMALEANLGGEQLSVFDLQRIRIPSGGQVAWEVPGLDGEPEYKKHIDGIIVFTKMGRSFWREDITETGGGTPPDCSSPDGIYGIGDPGIKCAECPYAQFGSREALKAAPDGRLPILPPDANRQRLKGKAAKPACKQQRFVFLLSEGGSLPSVMTLPPSSLGPMRQFLIKLSLAGRPYWSVLTRFQLAQVKNADGIAFAEARPTILRQLTTDEVIAVQEYGVRTRETFNQYRENASTVEAADLDEGVGYAGEEVEA